MSKQTRRTYRQMPSGWYLVPALVIAFVFWTTLFVWLARTFI